MTDISKEAVDALLQGVSVVAWKVVRNRDNTLSIIGGLDADGYTHKVCLVNNAREANARFIAAARELVPALRAALDEAEAREAALLAANEINRETLLRHNADCDRRIRKAEAERDAAIAAARIAYDALWELNPNNYDHDEVCKVNDGSVEAILTLAPIIGETHGKPPEWWAERAAHLGAKP